MFEIVSRSLYVCVCLKTEANLQRERDKESMPKASMAVVRGEARRRQGGGRITLGHTAAGCAAGYGPLHLTMPNANQNVMPVLIVLLSHFAYSLCWLSRRGLACCLYLQQREEGCLSFFLLLLMTLQAYRVFRLFSRFVCRS